MEMTKLGRSGIEVGILGLGMEHLENVPREQVITTVQAALDAGMSYLDIFMPSPNVRTYLGEALTGRREQAVVAGHLGALWVDGQYTKSRDAVQCEKHAQDLLTRMNSTYLDVLMLHFIDDKEDFDAACAPGGILDVALRWKKEGKARTIGMSTHTASAGLLAVANGNIDVIMFPVNPEMDTVVGDAQINLLFENEAYVGDHGVDPMRAEFYRACQREDIAIVAMKMYAAGWLLKEENRLGLTMTPAQCAHYALSQPGVRVALPGCKNVDEVNAALTYLRATDAQKDYSALSGSRLWKLGERCMYCNHCLPCPSNIDIAALTRLVDAAQGGVSAGLQAQYQALTAKASECSQCGACEQQCPFHVQVRSNMDKAVALFE